MGKFQDLTGKTFGRLTVLERGPNTQRKATTWLCRCECGEVRLNLAGNLVGGKSTSCGCLKVDYPNRTTHGMHGAPEYGPWMEMWRRCTNRKRKNYSFYRDKKPPKAWRDFAVFFAEIGPRPSLRHSIDRIKNHLPYGPGNVKWSTQQEQCLNSSNVVKVLLSGREMSIAQACAETGLVRTTVYSRWRRTKDMSYASGGLFDIPESGKGGKDDPKIQAR